MATGLPGRGNGTFARAAASDPGRLEYSTGGREKRAMEVFDDDDEEEEEEGEEEEEEEEEKGGCMW
ncbi:hypothetical protein Trco_001241 [Trichoderma cornu-damae]|uniref:Uncharacterized protein n=1 Tax=Trichoderma cornu-damae TaxID=654480 RepID=A0A9P8QTL1_9HYPO|nr:hypothetical protein Trco_001241 [Trichoderma cornu-damae]